MKSYGSDHLGRFIGHLEATRFNTPAGLATVDDWAIEVTDRLLAIQSAGANLYFVGNGASQGMSSHFSTDLTKNGWIKARALTDPSLLTCFGNDYSYETAFAEALKRYFEPGDGLVAISSSGRSANIVNACQVALDRSPSMVLGLTGFGEDNPVSLLTSHGCWVPIEDYGMVESAHAYFFHLVMDLYHQRREAS